MKKRIVNWIRKQVKDAGAKGIVLGLSGGIDSSVVVCLCKEAVGKRNVLGLFLPCNSNPLDFQDAKAMADKLGIKTRYIDLSRMYNSILKMLPAANNLALANLKPRLRMLVLYYFANKLNYLVCGTGNKSEFLAGYFTKHGDGATDILPIADLYKKQVKELARELKVPERIILKHPSAGLWPGQTDEGEMGIAYDELDDILERIDKKKVQVKAKIKVEKVKRMMAGSEHKRQGARICYI